MILTDTIGLIDIHSPSGRNRLIHNFKGNEIAQLVNFFENIYGQSEDFVLMNNTQENISLKLEKYISEKVIPQQFKSDI